MPARVVWTPYGRPALDALKETVAQLKQDQAPAPRYRDARPPAPSWGNYPRATADAARPHLEKLKEHFQLDSSG